MKSRQYLKSPALFLGVFFTSDVDYNVDRM
jgi:hypothetical protein